MFSGIHHEMTLYVQYTRNQAVKKWLPLELICAIFLEYIVTIHFVCPYHGLLTLYVQYTKTLAVKKWLPFELVDLEYIVTIHFVHPSIPKFTDLICLVHQDPSGQKVASIWAYMWSIVRVHRNLSLCLSVPKFIFLICSVHQDPSRQKVASIWAYMCSRLRVHSDHSLCLSIPKFTDLICSVVYISWTDLICSVHQELSRQKVASIWV